MQQQGMCNSLRNANIDSCSHPHHAPTAACQHMTSISYHSTPWWHKRVTHSICPTRGLPCSLSNASCQCAPANSSSTPSPHSWFPDRSNVTKRVQEGRSEMSAAVLSLLQDMFRLRRLTKELRPLQLGMRLWERSSTSSCVSFCRPCKLSIRFLPK